MTRTGHQSSDSIGRCHLPSKLLDSGVTVSLKAPREDRIQGGSPCVSSACSAGDSACGLWGPMEDGVSPEQGLPQVWR